MIWADDYGYSRAVNDAIDRLCEKRKIQGFSVMVNGPALDESDIHRVIHWKSQGIRIGLHLNLTERFSGGEAACEPFRATIWCLLRKPTLISEAVETQWNRFVNIFGFQPDLVDSHHHIHQVPVLRRKLIDSLVNQNSRGDLFVRNTYYPSRWILQRAFKHPFKLTWKILSLSLIGASCRKFLLRSNLKTNSVFMGVNPFDPKIPYSEIAALYEGAGPVAGALYVIHPSLESPAGDAINSFRVQEYLHFERLSQGELSAEL